MVSEGTIWVLCSAAGGLQTLTRRRPRAAALLAARAVFSRWPQPTRCPARNQRFSEQEPCLPPSAAMVALPWGPLRSPIIRSPSSRPTRSLTRQPVDRNRLQMAVERLRWRSSTSRGSLSASARSSHRGPKPDASVPSPASPNWPEHVLRPPCQSAHSVLVAAVRD